MEAPPGFSSVTLRSPLLPVPQFPLRRGHIAQGQDLSLLLVAEVHIALEGPWVTQILLQGGVFWTRGGCSSPGDTVAKVTVKG